MALEQEIEKLKDSLPVLGRRVPHGRIDDLEGVGERHTYPAGYLRNALQQFVAVEQIELGSRGQMVKDRPQFNFFVQLPKLVDALLETLRNRQIPKLEHAPVVEAGRRLSDQQQVIQLFVDKFAVSLQVVLVDVYPAGSSKQPFQ